LLAWTECLEKKDNEVRWARLERRAFRAHEDPLVWQAAQALQAPRETRECQVSKDSLVTQVQKETPVHLEIEATQDCRENQARGGSVVCQVPPVTPDLLGSAAPRESEVCPARTDLQAHLACPVRRDPQERLERRDHPETKEDQVLLGYQV
jgi:hypothetical protein